MTAAVVPAVGERHAVWEVRARRPAKRGLNHGFPEFRQAATQCSFSCLDCGLQNQINLERGGSGSRCPRPAKCFSWDGWSTLTWSVAGRAMAAGAARGTRPDLTFPSTVSDPRAIREESTDAAFGQVGLRRSDHVGYNESFEGLPEVQLIRNDSGKDQHSSATR